MPSLKPRAVSESYSALVLTAANPEALAGMAVGDVSDLTTLRVRDRTIALDLDRAIDAAVADALLD